MLSALPQMLASGLYGGGVAARLIGLPTPGHLVEKTCDELAPRTIV